MPAKKLPPARRAKSSRVAPWSKPRLPRGQARIQWSAPNASGAAKLHVPAALARLISPDAIFQPEITEDGILYRYVEGQEPVELPRWMREAS